jgi:hypothetical protein
MQEQVWIRVISAPSRYMYRVTSAALVLLCSKAMGWASQQEYVYLEQNLTAITKPSFFVSCPSKMLGFS